MISAIKTWLEKCDCFDDLKELGVDFLSSDANVASIEKSPGQKTIERKVNGDSIKQINIILRAWFPYSDEIKQNIENSEFYENVSDWIEEQVETNDLPVFKNNKVCTNVEVTTSDYLISVSDNMRKACYQMQFRVEYRKVCTNDFSKFYK